MDFSRFLFVTFLSSLALLITPSMSLTCTKQNFRNNKIYANCTDLPVLDSFLHYTYNRTNSSLSIAFIATPVTPEGWVAWGINPTMSGMLGSQALVAFESNSFLTVKTYNISSYDSVQVSNLSFAVWDTSAESFQGNIVIFATVSVPQNAERLNQVWQVGAVVNDDNSLGPHELTQSHLDSKGVLELVDNSNPVPGPSVNKSGISGIEKLNFGLIIGLFVFIVFIVVF